MVFHVYLNVQTIDFDGPVKFSCVFMRERERKKDNKRNAVENIFLFVRLLAMCHMISKHVNRTKCE